MADVFDLAQSRWSYRAEAAEILRTTQLPIPSGRFSGKASAARTCSGRSAQYWSAAMAGQDFRTEDRLNTDVFNSALWRGLGIGPEPSQRDGRDLRRDRDVRMKGIEPAPCASGS